MQRNPECRGCSNPFTPCGFYQDNQQSKQNNEAYTELSHDILNAPLLSDSDNILLDLCYMAAAA